VLYAACRFDRPDHRGTVLDVDRPGESAFAPSPDLLAALAAGRAGWRQFERHYTAEMRALYRRDRALWVELVEQAAVEDLTLAGAARGDERTVRCPRRVLFDLLVAVAADRGLRVDPETDALQITLLEARRREVLIAAGLSLTCPVCHRPASTDLAVPGRDGYGYCSTDCREREAARRRASQWTPDSARRP
jgi:uncharacterized protein YeaO (DUF488 family)